MSVSMKQRMASVNRWRESLNPLRGLTIQRAVALTEDYFAGRMADVQWTFFHIEGSDADLFTIVDRRAAALLEMDTDIPITSDVPKELQGLALEQQHALREAYDNIVNLYEAIEHMEMAAFRGFAHCELHRAADGRITRLEPVDQWNVLRDGLTGGWRYNPEAKSTTFAGLGSEHDMPPELFLVRECPRFVNRVALLKFVRQNLSQRDWDAYMDIYGIPGWVITGPPNVAPAKEEEYRQAAEDVAEGGSGYLPHGSEARASDSPRGSAPFELHMRYLTERLVLVGTGGLLTMLTASGSGTLAGSAHQAAFNQIARGAARRISELFQRRIDREVLAREFPGRPPLAYFTLSATESVGAGEYVERASKLAAAGFRLDPTEVEQKSGVKLTASVPIANGKPAISKPADGIEAVQDRVARVLAITDDAAFELELKALKTELPGMLEGMGDALTEQLVRAMTGAVATTNNHTNEND